VIPSSEALAEDWDDVMASGDLDASRAWLVRDVHEKAAHHNRFYVMQANPNNNEELMYQAMIAGRGPQSNKAFLAPFLNSLGDLVMGAVSSSPASRINVVSTDFLNVSRPYDIAMKLMGLSVYV